MQDVTQLIFEEVVERPFLDFMARLVSVGSDPHARVEKLLRYRQAEKMRLSNIGVAGNEVKKRDELMHERNLRVPTELGGFYG